MAYGLRFHSVSLALGSRFDYYVPDQDMPEANNTGRKGNTLIEDINITPFGNSWIYEKGKYRKWTLSFQNINTVTTDAILHCVEGWHKLQQVTVIAFGTSVYGTVTTMGSLSTAGQIWGTSYIRFSKMPQEEYLDMWNFEIDITEYGTNQTF